MNKSTIIIILLWYLNKKKTVGKINKNLYCASDPLLGLRIQSS